MEDTSSLKPCNLGTKEYWDNAYDLEIKNYQDNGDTGGKLLFFGNLNSTFYFSGEIWFEESSQQRIIRWLNKHNIPNDSSILDLGELYYQFYSRPRVDHD